MGGEKHGSKGGRGFLQLFDWNAKSRKKLFSGKSDLPGQPKQKKRSDGNLPTTRFNLLDEDEIVTGSSIKGSSDYSCASSVTDEEGYGTRAAGVVARLMGLDLLPTSNLQEPFSTPFFDSQSLRDAHHHRRNFESRHIHQIMHSGNLHNEVEFPVQKAVESKPRQKTMNRPIEKFQTEILPPKSAKSIPITHHKLLSPIKSPGFITSKNAAHIMEAAAKIIEPGPQVSNKTKIPLIGNSSVPFKVRDLKEKAEASQKASRNAEASSSIRRVETNAAKFLKGQSVNKSLNGLVDATSFRVSSDLEVFSGIKDKGKSGSLALQAKVNVQRREGLVPRGGSTSCLNERSEATQSQPFNFQSNSQNSMQKKPSMHKTSGVLRQNNQKQNCLIDKGKLSPKSSLPDSQGRKVMSGDSSIRRHKNLSNYGGNSKVGARKLSPEIADGKREVPNSSTRNFPRKKRSIDGNFHEDKVQVVDSLLVNKTEKPTLCDSVVDRHFTWAEDRKRKGLDVVSFTFTAPMTRLVPGDEISRHMSEKSTVFSADYGGKKVQLNSDGTNSRKLSSKRCNVTEADDLSILLEQKLRELTNGVESSRCRAGMAGNSVSIFQDSVPTFKAVPTTPTSRDQKSQDGTQREKLGGLYGSNFSSTDFLGLATKHKLKGTVEMDEFSSDDTATRKSLHYRHPSPISVLEPSFLTESCNSSDTADTNSIEGSKRCSSVQAQELLCTSSSKNFLLTEIDTELSDSASSTSSGTVARRSDISSSKSHFVGSTKWEVEYVKEILLNVDLMFKDFALGRASKTVNPNLFELLENREEGLETQGNNEPKLRRKVLFDCVSECMDLRCRTWAKGLSTLRRKRAVSRRSIQGDFKMARMGENEKWEGLWRAETWDVEGGTAGGKGRERVASGGGPVEFRFGSPVLEKGWRT
ncbi:hypothetical protein Acr_20g0008740 [Actinidia rufa]|uniref:DUF3741 domain-containing protein n=1 Tax=Actinidia rufa TaxID=165716 RepID=A0A7J0GE25_9ERIC|nr:hypothetical protein Acr_20g0008740 [Actinidia rufa]